MCPLDMKGLIGAATVVGSLQHGAGVCEEAANEAPLRIGLKATNFTTSTSDATFLHFRFAARSKSGKYPPSALIEVHQDLEAEVAKLRRLHLIIVDLLHPKRKQTLAFG